MHDLAQLDGNAAADLLRNLAAASAGNIEAVEGEMLKHEQASCGVIHRFGPGVYIREVRLPAGILAVGHHQNFEHVNIMLEGRVTILNDNGTTTELVAPTIFTGKPGRKVGYVHEDVVWLNVYPTTETDVEKLEAKYITKSDTWMEGNGQRLLTFQTSIDRDDYAAALAEFGLTEEIARSQSENTDDMMELPDGGYKIKLAPSNIEGKGLFATADIGDGEVIAPARISGMRTIAGRYTNHSATPNARMERAGNSDINLVATRPIAGCRGGFDGEEITIDYRQARALTLSIGKEH